MSLKSQGNKTVMGIALPVALLFAVYMLMYMEIAWKWIIVLAALGMAALLFLRDLKLLRNVSALLLLGYVLFGAVSAAWAISGKFFMKEYAKVFLATAVFLCIMLRPQFNRRSVQQVMLTISIISALVAFLSVEIASTGVVLNLLSKVPTLSTAGMGFESRLYGLFSNSNVEASIYAVGILASLASLQSADTKWMRIVAAVCAALSAYAFLLCISLGAMACFALAVVVYLIAAGHARMGVLLRMFAVAIPSILFGVVAFNFFQMNAFHVMPLLLMVADAAVVALLETYVLARIEEKVNKYAKLPLILIIGAVCLVVAYMVAAMQLTSAYTFSGTEIRRSDYTQPGQHTLMITADGDVEVTIASQSRYQILQSSSGELYSGPANGEISFTVPEGAEVCTYIFRGEDGSKMTSAVIDGEKSLPLKYVILPESIAARLQGAWKSSSLVVRQVLWDYGMRIFRLHPLNGSSFGGYENGLTRVEDFYYQTKYVHNHYIQVLLETGVIGSACYFSFLLSMAWLLIKKHRFHTDEELGWCYPALASVFVMMATITLWDISMSNVMYIGMIYAIFAIIIRLFAKPFPVKEKAVEGTLTKKERAVHEQKKHRNQMILQGACALIPCVFAITIIGNIYAQSLLKREVQTYDQFFNNVKLAAEIDPYEYNDAKLSYVISVLQNDEENMEYRLPTANAYAEELLQVQSNSIPYYLEIYYGRTQQYEKVIEAAKAAAVYSASDPEVWNNSFSLMWDMIVIPQEGLAANLDTLLPQLVEYCDLFTQRNETALVPIDLNPLSRGAYESILSLNKIYQEDPARVLDLLAQLYEANVQANLPQA